MYKLLIVEDEMLLRQGIVHMLNWTEHDFLIVGQGFEWEGSVGVH